MKLFGLFTRGWLWALIGLWCSVLGYASETMNSMAPEDSCTEAIFKAYWIKHEYQPYRLSHLEYTLLSGDTLSQECFSMLADVYVVDSSSTQYTLRWRLHNYSIQTDHYLSKQWINSLNDMEITYTTSVLGVLKDFKNVPDFDQSLNVSIDKLFSGYQGSTTYESRQRLYGLRDDFEAFVLSCIYQHHQVYGLGYTLGEVVEVPTQVETRFSKTPVDAVVYKKLDSCIDGVATLVCSTQLDSMQLHKAIQSYTLEKNPLRQENLSAVVMHLPSGWPLYIFESKEAYDGKKTYGELIEITHKNK